MQNKKVTRIMIVIAFIFIIPALFIILYYVIPLKRSLFLKPIYRFNTSKKIVALTFDDGPSSQCTPLLLDLLKKKSVKATFFMTGEKILKNRKIAERVLKEGHTIGHHTFGHYKMIFKSRHFIENDITKMDKIFNSIGIPNAVYFRPPHGLKIFNLPFILKKMGKKMVTWNVEPKSQYDGENADCKTDVDYVIKKTKPGSIILLHDGWNTNHDVLLCTVEQVINRLRKEGYSFVTVDAGLKIEKTSDDELKSNF